MLFIFHESPITTQKMKVFDNIGLGLFLFSIVSLVFWSPRPFSISHGFGDAIDKVSQKEQFFVEKARNIPFKTDLTTKDIIGRMKIDVEDSGDLYSNSLIRTNEENVNPKLNEISNWPGIDQDPLIIQKHIIKPEEKVCEVRIASKEIGKGNLDASYITSNDLKDTSYGQNIELYKQTTKTYDQSNDWVADHAHEVFDKSGLVVDVVENEVGKIMDTTLQEMDMKKNLKSLNNSVSNIVGSLEENVCEEDLNESNTLHNNLQLLGTNNIEDDVENTTNIVHTNVQLLGVDNSNDFIVENEYKNSQELSEQSDQMSKAIGPNLIEQSFTRVNNLWSMFVEDSKINEVKNDHLNSQKEFHKSKNDQESIYNQNENFDEATKKYHREVSSPQYKHLQGDYDDDTNYEGVKGKIIKYSHRTYEGDKVDTNGDYKTSKYSHHARNHAHHHYRDGRHKASEVYKPMNDAIRKFRKNNQYNDNECDGDDDEDFYNDYNEDFDDDDDDDL